MSTAHGQKTPKRDDIRDNVFFLPMRRRRILRRSYARIYDNFGPQDSTVYLCNIKQQKGLNSVAYEGLISLELGLSKKINKLLLVALFNW